MKRRTLAALLATPALAQGRPVRLIVAYAPGGAVDSIARRMAPPMSELLGQPVVVENRAGATGTIGAAEVARAAPDGLTLLAMDNSYAMIPGLFQRLPFDHATAFRPVSVSAFSPVMLAVHRDAPWPDLAALITAGRARPEALTYGSGGIGSTLHLGGFAFADAAGMRMLHAPFRGAGEAVTAVLARQVDVVMISPGSALGSLQAGLLRPLAVSGEQRSAALPAAPTFIEAGLAGFRGMVNWSGLAAPARTDEAIIARLHAAQRGALATPGMASFLAGIASTPGGMPPEAMTALIVQETALWRDVARRAGIEQR